MVRSKIHWLFIIIPYLILFKSFFLSGYLAWGDAPYFYTENLKELFNLPFSWDFRNSNFGASQIIFLWLYLPTFVMGAFNILTGWSHEVLVRLVFYFPATILAILGSYFYIKKYTQNKLALILGIFLYSFNTYNLVLIDGGQIGVALAYGVFPFALITLRRFYENFNFRNLVLAILVNGFLSNIDLRIFILPFLTQLLFVFIFNFNTKKIGNEFLKLSGLVLLVVTPIILLDSFWIYPLLKSHDITVNFYSNNPGFLSLIYGLSLYNPHFPNNEFGKISEIPFYFTLLPLLIFAGLFKNPSRITISISLEALIFIFLLKGSSPPFGDYYNFILQYIPFASAFRDSSKFFIPTLLLSATLLSINFSRISNFFKGTNTAIYFFAFIYLYLNLLIAPSLMGNLTGALSGKPADSNFQKIYQELKKEKSFFRTVWFPERPPLGFSYMNKEGLNANLLYHEFPFASMIIGDYDLFYFLHDPKLTDWFKLMGIKYAFFPEPERKKTWTEKELDERKQFLEFVDKRPGFKKLNWSEIPAYEIEGSLDKIFGQDRIILVLGDLSVYKKLPILTQGLVFLEDGLSDPDKLLDLPKESIIILLNKRDQNDLTQTFLQKFYNNVNLQSSNWGWYPKDKFLSAKYELLKHGIESDDLLFNKGIYFSNIKGEELVFSKKIETSGDYFLITRTISASQSAGLKMDFRGKQYQLKNDSYTWQSFGPFSLSTGKQTIRFENLGGFQAVNVIYLVPQYEYKSAQSKAKVILKRYESTYEIDDISKNYTIHEIGYNQENPTKYKIKVPKKMWVVFTDHYDPGWNLISKNNVYNSIPFYSMVNGFWVNEAQDMDLEYKPQKDVHIGFKISVATLLILLALGLKVLYNYLKVNGFFQRHFKN